MANDNAALIGAIGNGYYLPKPQPAARVLQIPAPPTVVDERPELPSEFLERLAERFQQMHDSFAPRYSEEFAALVRETREFAAMARSLGA